MTLVSLDLSGLKCLSLRQQMGPEHFNLLSATGVLSEGYLSRESPVHCMGQTKELNIL